MKKLDVHDCISTTKHPDRYEYIDLLRGIAILGVLAVHAHQAISHLWRVTEYAFNFGQMGVQLFFISSSITLCLSADARNEGNFFNFYIRRFFRIAPLYYYGICVYFFSETIATSYAQKRWAIPHIYAGRAILENIFFVHGFDPKNFNLLVPGGWSISAEMAFYVVFPLLFAILKKFNRLQFVFFAVGASLMVFLIEFVSIKFVEPYLLNIGAIRSIAVNNDFGWIYTSFINQFPVFLVGMASFQFLQEKTSVFHAILAAILVFLSCLIQNERLHDTGFDGLIYPLLASLGFSLFAIKLSQTPQRKSWVSGVIVKMGRLSYSMYINHFLVLSLLKGMIPTSLPDFGIDPQVALSLLYLCLIAVTYSTAKITYKYIERPGIDFGKKIILRLNSHSYIPT